MQKVGVTLSVNTFRPHNSSIYLIFSPEDAFAECTQKRGKQNSQDWATILLIMIITNIAKSSKSKLDTEKKMEMHVKLML